MVFCLKNYSSNYYSTKASIYISPEVSIFMKWNWPEMFFQSSIFSCFTSVFSSKNYCHWFFFHILYPHTLCRKNYCQKQCYKSQWNWDKQTPSQNKWEWETYCSDFLITEEFFLSSVTGWEEGKSFNRKLCKLLTFWKFAVITILEVTVFLKAVKWHQNTAAVKVKLNLWVTSENIDNS